MREEQQRNWTLVGSFVLSCLFAAVAVLGVAVVRSRTDSESGDVTISATEDSSVITSASTEPFVQAGIATSTVAAPQPTSAPPAPESSASTTITTTTVPQPPPPPPRSDQVSVGYGLATCESGFEMVFGGSTRDGFDIAICADSRGSIRYHGIKRGSNADIRLWACLWGGSRFEAINAQHRYIIDLSDLPEALVVIGPEGETLVNDSFLQTTFTPTNGLSTC